jgi:cellulose synthase/poly-beta-1,6-N-acetylglucosamine synthase-like glycosyltransferase
MRLLEWSLVAMVMAGTLPPLVGCYQFVLVALHPLRRGRLGADAVATPRVAIIVPAWNEAAVIVRTVDQLLDLDYPSDRFRVYVVDDGSDDGTPALVRGLADAHPGRVFHLRRENGGQGKAHTINYGLRTVQAEDWFEAVLVIDADVLFTRDSLRRMTNHLADPDVGAVTGYIKEGTRPGNFLNRFVAFEYVTAQAGARRAQNILGATACLAGGAQLIRRESLESIGGAINIETLAEDTVTTLMIQLGGERVVFEPQAIVWAEEPSELGGLWKQRVRWGRGNVQVTSRFRWVWFHLRSWGALSGVTFGLIWFTVTLMPVFMVASSIGLVALYLLDSTFSQDIFRALWGVNFFTYLFITVSSFLLDRETARRAWREGLAFPGLISLTIILYARFPQLFRDAGLEPHGALLVATTLCVYVWLSASMLAAYLVKKLEDGARFAWAVAPLVYVVGYGPLLCAMTVAAYWREYRGVEMRWEKTEKLGKVGVPA